MSEEILKRVMDLFDKAQGMIFEVSSMKGYVESMTTRLESLEKGFNGVEVQGMITRAIRENLSEAKIFDITEIVASQAIALAEKRLKQSDWELLNQVERKIGESARETLNEALRSEDVREAIMKIIKANLAPAVEEVLVETVGTIIDKGLDHVVMEQLKEEVEKLPETILKRFGYKVKEDC